MRPTLNPVLHDLAGSLFLIGLRDRLRCPECGKVGTWKPHGGFVDGILARFQGHKGTRTTRRWLCKWCGHYVGPEGVMRAWPSKAKGCWILGIDEDEEPGPTPKDALETAMGRVNPWLG